MLGYTPPWQATHTLARTISTLTVFDLETATALHTAARTAGQRLTVHVKVNTGMNRLGVRPDAAPALLAALATLDGLVVEGIFTHFATSDEQATRIHAKVQFTCFTELLATLDAAGCVLPSPMPPTPPRC